MDRNLLAERIITHLDVLCTRIVNRCTGSRGNLQATAYVRETLAALGLIVECPRFRCFEWRPGEVRLRVGDVDFAVFASPFSLPFDGTASLEEASDLHSLKHKTLGDRIVLIHGELASEPLMPKNFVPYNPERHQAIIRTLEAQRPAAVIAATGKHPQMAGAHCPFPLFEDGDFEIPAVYMKDTDGRKLLAHKGERVRLTCASRRIASEGYNVIATRPGIRRERVVLTAHIDAKMGTRGALDNASGVAVLLGVGEVLRQYTGGLTVELAVLNGEDCYSMPGQMLYAKSQLGRWGEIRLAVNLDGVGYHNGKTAYSFYECPKDLEAECTPALDRCAALVPGPPWVQGDHSMFLMNGVPALAFTSDEVDYLTREIIHTDKDRVELLDPRALAEIAGSLAECVIKMGNLA